MLLILVIMAKDQATRQVWWEDEAYLSHINDHKEPRVYGREDFQPGKAFYFQDCSLFYAGETCSSSAFYHRAVKVKGLSSFCGSNETDFLKVLLRPEVYRQLQTHFEKTEKWKSLDQAYVNFTHFTPVIDSSDGFAFTKEGFFAGWQRHVAYILEKNFPACDIAIPMAFRYSKNITFDCMSFIMISLKNRSGNDMIGEPFLTRQCVEGIYLSRQNGEKGKGRKNSKRVKKGKDGKTGKRMIVSVGDNVLVKLTLHSLKFINFKGIPSSRDISDDAWIQTSKDKPFIAFAMSMGDTNREEDLFVGEKSVIRYAYIQ